jgi:hypothetical protein
LFGNKRDAAFSDVTATLFLRSHSPWWHLELR